MKKLISILLAVMLVVSGMSLSTFAADEAYRYDFDTGLLAGNGGASSGSDATMVTGSDFEVFTDAESIRLRGWCYTVSGVATLSYNLAGAGWVQIADGDFEDRTDVYAAITQEFVNLGIPAEKNTTKSGFDFYVPIAGANLAVGTNSLQVKVVTNNAVEIMIADVTFNYCEPYTSTEPIESNKRGKVQFCADWYKTFRDGAETGVVNTTDNTASLQFVYGNADFVGTRGWISVGSLIADQNAEFLMFGYSYNDDANIVYDDAFAVATEQGVIDAGEYECDQRFEIMVPVADLAVGTHTIKTYCQLISGEQIIMSKITVVVTDRTAEVIPEEKMTDSVADFDDNSGCTFDYSNYTDGLNLSLLTGEVGGYHPFRSVWSPRPKGAGSATVVVGADGNKYAQFTSHYSYFSDYRWKDNYTFYADIAITQDANDTRGLRLNFSHERLDGDGDVDLYSDYAVVDGITVTGKSGAIVSFKNATTLQIVILTYNVETATQGAVIGNITLDEATQSLDTFKSVAAVDNGEGAIFILVEDVLVAKITYADAATLSAGPYYEGYYRTATVVAADGTVVAETTDALMSKYQTVGIGTRSYGLSVDNILLAPAIDVVDTTIQTAPTEITLVDGSIYSIDTTNSIITVKSTSFSSGVTYAELMSNFATPSQYIQIINPRGAVITSGGRLSNSFSINLIDDDGNIVKPYSFAFVGDLNSDGRINGSDTSYLQSNNSGYAAGTVAFCTANVNGDRRVNGSDLSYLLGLAQIGSF